MAGRHGLVVAALLLILTTALPARAADAPAGKGRNVLLMIADDLGRHLGCYGDPVVHTPNVDRLAAEGTRFNNAFASVASCSPSRSTILTGLHIHQNGQYGLAHGVNNQTTKENIRSLPALLNDAGYRTAVLGKNHVRPQSVYPYHLDTVVEGGNRSPAAFADAVGKFIGEEKDKPFFLVVGFSDPHRAGKGFANDAKRPGYEPRRYDPAKVPVPAHLPDTPAVRADLADYYESVSRMDACVGRVMEALDGSGRRDETLVIFLSDNGMPFPGAKTNLYDAAIRLPLIVRLPGAPAGATSEALVSWVDVAPAVLEWTSLKPPRYPLAGKSFLPNARDASAKGHDAVFGSHLTHEITMWYPMRAVRTATHKLIWNLDPGLTFRAAGDLGRSPSFAAVQETGKLGGRTYAMHRHRPEFELYDVASDPDEMKNLADDPAHAATLAELKGRIHAMMRDTKDPWAERINEDKANESAAATR